MLLRTCTERKSGQHRTGQHQTAHTHTHVEEIMASREEVARGDDSAPLSEGGHRPKDKMERIHVRDHFGVHVHTKCTGQHSEVHSAKRYRYPRLIVYTTALEFVNLPVQCTSIASQTPHYQVGLLSNVLLSLLGVCKWLHHGTSTCNKPYKHWHLVKKRFQKWEELQKR